MWIGHLLCGSVDAQLFPAGYNRVFQLGASPSMPTLCEVGHQLPGEDLHGRYDALG